MTNIIDKINIFQEALKEPPRPHMGCSIIGAYCQRQTWLTFRWAFEQKIDGRLYRIFRRGKLEEENVLIDLRSAGYNVVDYASDVGRVGLEVPDYDGQYKANFGPGHVTDSLNGFIEIDGEWHVLEIKTHNSDSFKRLESSGVKKSKPHHWVQMQLYMLATGLKNALYYAVNKNDDHIYTEVVEFDRAEAEANYKAGVELSLSQRMPEPCSYDPEYYLCKWCDAHEFCHQGKQLAPTNCRTCAASIPTDDGQWHCDKWQANIPVSAQYNACGEWVIHDDLKQGERK